MGKRKRAEDMILNIYENGPQVQESSEMNEDIYEAIFNWELMGDTLNGCLTPFLFEDMVDEDGNNNYIWTDASLKEYYQYENLIITDQLRIDTALPDFNEAIEEHARGEDSHFYLSHKINIRGEFYFILILSSYGQGWECNEIKGVYTSNEDIFLWFKDYYGPEVMFAGDECDEKCIEKRKAFILDNWQYDTKEYVQDRVDFDIQRKKSIKDILKNGTQEYGLYEILSIGEIIIGTDPEIDIYTLDGLKLSKYLNDKSFRKYYMMGKDKTITDELKIIYGLYNIESVLENPYVDVMSDSTKYTTKYKIIQLDGKDIYIVYSIHEMNGSIDYDNVDLVGAFESFDDMKAHYRNLGSGILCDEKCIEKREAFILENWDHNTEEDADLKDDEWDDKKKADSTPVIEKKDITTEDEVDVELKTLIQKFNEDDEYRRDILQRANTSILRADHSPLDSLAEKKLIEMIIMSRY
jgi:hypothetical protein